MTQEELLAKAILPSWGVTEGITILRNNLTGYVYVATDVTEETQLKHENHSHIEIIGDMVERLPMSKSRPGTGSRGDV